MKYRHDIDVIWSVKIYVWGWDKCNVYLDERVNFVYSVHSSVQISYSLCTVYFCTNFSFLSCNRVTTAFVKDSWGVPFLKPLLFAYSFVFFCCSDTSLASLNHLHLPLSLSLSDIAMFYQFHCWQWEDQLQKEQLRMMGSLREVVQIGSSGLVACLFRRDNLLSPLLVLWSKLRSLMVLITMRLLFLHNLLLVSIWSSYAFFFFLGEGVIFLIYSFWYNSHSIYPFWFLVWKGLTPISLL